MDAAYAQGAAAGGLALTAATALFAGKLEMDAQGYLLTDENLQTNFPGIYAAGDVRHKQLRQIVTAAADGALAAVQACQFLKGML